MLRDAESCARALNRSVTQVKEPISQFSCILGNIIQKNASNNTIFKVKINSLWWSITVSNDVQHLPATMKSTNNIIMRIITHIMT